jgi:hypothetical protein
MSARAAARAIGQSVVRGGNARARLSRDYRREIREISTAGKDLTRAAKFFAALLRG